MAAVAATLTKSQKEMSSLSQSSIPMQPTALPTDQHARREELQRRMRELSAMSDLPAVDVDEFDRRLHRQKMVMRQKKKEHEGWKKNFEKQKQRVMLRITEYTRRRRDQIHRLEQIVEETYQRHVHDRNTTDNEKTVERVILSREASRGHINPASTTPGEVPMTPVIVEEPGQEEAQSEGQGGGEASAPGSAQTRGSAPRQSRQASFVEPRLPNSRPVTRPRPVEGPAVRETRTSRERHVGSRQNSRL